ncbi:efflux transporter outer membrane subunit [Methylotuvimicrobium alcaliphilum]|uniref:Outer membrane efflux protein (OprM-family protein) n=1 Tax=Methylotuvimicrobium alcaliphilum (strain DSM 19304 / NCIMB 14124 / VKM B-2133 / 20Z) TaxID=1091494 RepID=G4SVR4_META2|nr:efflux transporter outer membrane subunit [Methylotuvimicrobium alcaliphilum]CCE24123.1 putative outer membrane efflux protein (OprM-family protein) [Methylotuvimicrobium alcaliphilum 20Z]
MRVINPSVLLIFFFLSACSIDIKEFNPPIPVPETFSITGGESLQDRWWLNFNDPALNTLIDTALQQNLDLTAAFERLKQAEAEARKAGAELIPAVNATTNANRLIEDNANTGSLTFDNFSLGLIASYEVDLWGRIRAGTYAAEQEIKAAEQDIHTAAIALSAEIARIWYLLTEQKLQLDLLNEQIEVNKQYADLVEVRFRGGQATAADVFQQRQLLEGVVGDRYTVLANIEVLKNQLAVLTGQAPGTLDIVAGDRFPELAGLPKTGLTSDLIQRRPDVMKAYYRLQAADLRIAAAVADRFPKLGLSASLDTSAPDLQAFFNNWMATLAGNLVLPLIDGGRRVAEVRRTEAATEEALNLYGQSVLQSLQEVENALAQETRQHERLDSLKDQLRYLNEANENIRIRSAYGIFDFLRVLSTLNSLQAMQRTLIRAERELIDFRIQLYRSLAGGWPLTEPVSNRNDIYD